eukprot:3565813-Pyramimonas_sp.AAC.1
MRMRFCHFGFKHGRANTLPSGSHLQVATTCTRIPTNLWRCAYNITGKPAEPAEQILDWQGQGAQKAEWRNKTLAIMTASLIDQMNFRMTQRNHTSAVHRSIHSRVDKGVRTCVQSPKNGPEWDHVVRRVAMNLGDNAIIQDIKIQDQPIGYNYNAPLPNGVTNIRARLHWEQPGPTLWGDGSSRPRSRRMAIIDDDRPPPPSMKRGRVFPSIPELPTLRSPETEQQTALPTMTRIKQTE